MSPAVAAHDWSFGIYVFGVVFICAFMLSIPLFLGGRDWGRAKNDPFESGVASVGGARMRLSAKFYLVAMFFVIFDVEALFLYAWSVSVRESGWAGFIEVTIFIFVLLAGLIYIWKLGALDWAPEGRRRRQQQARAKHRQELHDEQLQAIERHEHRHHHHADRHPPQQ